MFELLFKYPGAVFEKGQFVLLSTWPLWLLAIAVLAAGAALAWHVRRSRGVLGGWRPAAVWALETAMVALLLALLWRPAVSVATLRPQQNVVAVLVDDSRSMAAETANVKRVLSGSLPAELRKKFQVRMYRFGGGLERMETGGEWTGKATATHIGEALDRALAENSTLPLGAVVLVTDGGDTAGGIGRETLDRLRARRIPVHPVGMGPERAVRDIQLADAVVPARALPDSRLTAEVSWRQTGFAGQRARVSVREGNRVLASREVTLGREGTVQSETLQFDAGKAGPKTLRASVEPLAGEENTANNAVSRLVTVSAAKPRVLYIEGEPRWEFKFIRRAAEEDRSLELVTMLRTTPNKIYRQGIGNPQELEQGFPAKPEELFAYQGLIIGSVEAGYFTASQQDLIREFAGRRGGGVLFLGGRFALGEGGWAHAPAGELMPVQLPDARNTFHRDQSAQELTPAGRDSVICRLEEAAERNAERWKKMPQLANYNEVGSAKPGALVLMEVAPPGRRKSPLLAVQNYGRGRAALFATGGSWRWKMWQDHTDRTHQVFWQQMLRYLAAEAPGPVALSVERPVLEDEGRVTLRAEVRDKEYRPRGDALVTAHVTGPDGAPAQVEMRPQPGEPGIYGAEWHAPGEGSYVVEVEARRADEEVGRDVAGFRREDGVAESFHMTQDRELLERLAEETGGRYYPAARAARLANEISYSEAGITARETKDLWDMPVIFLLALLLRASEWTPRRKWGAV